MASARARKLPIIAYQFSTGAWQVISNEPAS